MHRHGLATVGGGLLLAATFTFAAAGAQAPASPGSRATETALVLRNVNLLDGTGAPPRTAVDVVLVGDRLDAIVPTGSSRPPAGTRELDVAGKWVIPGLIDSHAHYDRWMGEMFLYHGVTTVVDLGNPTKDIVATREAIRSGQIVGPRLLVAGLGIEGPSPDGSERAGGNAREPVRSAAEARTRTRQLLDAGVDLIKVHEWVPADWIREIAEEAHARNKAVVGHLSTPVGAAVDAGLDGLIHPYTVDLSTLSDPAKLQYIEQNMPKYAARVEYYPFHLLEPDKYAPLIEKLVAKGTFFNPTFNGQFRGVYSEREAFERYDDEFLQSQLPSLGYFLGPIRAKLLPFFTRLRFHEADAAQRKQLEAGMENVAELMRQFARAGGRMVAGTDTSTIGLPGIRLHRELQLWVSRGIDPVEALRAATEYSARLFRLDDVGVLAPGKKADLVVLEGNPLADMRQLGAIVAVVKDGRVLSRVLHPAAFESLLRRR